MKGQEMTEQADQAPLSKPSEPITSIDGVIRPRADDTAAQIRQHGACGGRSKTHSL